jgi:YidC/Oxa1 family membrane protein insertase
LIPSESRRQKGVDSPLGLVTADSNINQILASKNYALSGAEGDDGDTLIEVKQGGESRVVEFKAFDEATGLNVTKRFEFSPDTYSIKIGVSVTRGNQNIPDVRLALGPSIGDQGVSYYTFYSVAPEGIASVDGSVTRLLASSIHDNSGGWFSSQRPEGADRQIVVGKVDWAGVGDTYFAMVAVLPSSLAGLEYRTSKYVHDSGGTKEDRYLITGYVPIPSDGTFLSLYTGPKDHYLLTGASQELSSSLGRNVDLEGIIDYGLFSTVSRPIAVPILWAIKRLNALTGSYGVAIILFTIIIYSLFFPLKWRSSKSMKKAQKMAPKMKEVQEKIKGLKQNDPRLKELQMEQLRLMKEGNPLGGCLPILIQMPFLFALFRAITISIDFRQASFLWLPDLSAADPIHLLPFLMAGSMVVLQLITPAPSADPLQRKMMAVVLPVMMLYMMWSAPAGLLVYWLVGNIVGFSQQMLINRLIKTEDDEEPPAKKKADIKAGRVSTQVSQA